MNQVFPQPQGAADSDPPCQWNVDEAEPLHFSIDHALARRFGDRHSLGDKGRPLAGWSTWLCLRFEVLLLVPAERFFLQLAAKPTERSGVARIAKIRPWLQALQHGVELGLLRLIEVPAPFRGVKIQDLQIFWG